MKLLDYPENTPDDNIETCIICTEPLYSSLIITNNGFFFENLNLNCENATITNNSYTENMYNSSNSQNIIEENMYNSSNSQNMIEENDMDNSNLELYNELIDTGSYENNLSISPPLISANTETTTSPSLITPEGYIDDYSLKTVDLSNISELSSYNTLSNNSSVSNSRHNSISSIHDILEHWKCNQCQILIHEECMKDWITRSINNSQYRCPHCNLVYIRKEKKRSKVPYLDSRSFIYDTGNCIKCGILLIVMAIITVIVYYFFTYFIPLLFRVNVNITTNG